MNKGKLFFIGHSHLDVAWLWPIEETMEICKKLFKDMVNLMEKYPYFTYAQSTALYYKWIENDQELFNKVREFIRRDQWEIVGGSWVESDCLMLSTESLIRQFLYGKRYFRDRFGVDVEVAWFPDTFGFPPTLPQILVKSGIKYFITQKLNWNDTVLYPYNIFWWEGLDGSKVLAYQTIGGYSEDPRNVAKLDLYLKIIDARQGIRDILILCGIGDHGGGPTEDMILSIKELPEKLSGVEVSYCRSIDYLKYVEKRYGSNLPIYRGELYLQFHRGTYTSQVKIKELIKDVEYLLEVLEKLLTIRYMLVGKTYDREELRGYWYTALISQFHDVLAGSLSKTPYVQFRKLLRDLATELRKKIENVMREIIYSISPNSHGRKCLVVFNPNSRPRDVFIYIPHTKNVQRVLNIMDGNEYGLVKVKIPSLGFKIISLEKVVRDNLNHNDINVLESAEYITLENSYVKFTIDRSTGRIISLYNKLLNQEFLDNYGIRFEIYDDTPILGRIVMGRIERFIDYFFDSWEVFYLQHIDGVKFVELNKPIRVELIEKGPIRCSVLIEYLYRDGSNSKALIRHYIRLYSNEPWVEGIVDVEWRCVHRMLKLSIDLNYWSEYIAVGQNYGYSLRRNPASPYSTLFDKAYWEANYNKWLDYSDGRRGFAFICGTRFGYDFISRTLRLTLLRSPRYPPNGSGTPWTPKILESQEVPEQERHVIRYYMYTHKGDCEEAKVPTIAEDLLIQPYTMLMDVGTDMELEILRIMPEELSVSAIKLGEDSENIVMRVINNYDKNYEVEIDVLINSIKISEVSETNLLEDTIDNKNEVVNNKVKIQVNRYEIKTLELLAK